MTKLSVNKTKWTGLLATTALLFFRFSFEYLISGPISYRDFRETGPWIDSGQSYLFIYQLIRPSVRPFVRSFFHSLRSFAHSLTRSWFCHACRHTFVRSIMYACIHLCTFLQKSVELPVQRKRFMSMAFFEIQ